MRSAVVVGIPKCFLDAVSIEHDLGDPAPCRPWRQASVAERNPASPPATAVQYGFFRSGRRERLEGVSGLSPIPTEMSHRECGNVVDVYLRGKRLFASVLDVAKRHGPMGHCPPKAKVTRSNCVGCATALPDVSTTYLVDGGFSKAPQTSRSHPGHTRGATSMASLRYRNDKWQVQVRRYGHTPQSKSFRSKVDAQRWARHIEGELDRTLIPNDPRLLSTITIAEVLTRYRDTHTQSHRGHVSKPSALMCFCAPTGASCHWPRPAPHSSAAPRRAT